MLAISPDPTSFRASDRERLGYDDPPSYTELLFESLTGLEVGSGTANAATVLLFAVSLVLSVVLNVRDWRRARQRR